MYYDKHKLYSHLTATPTREDTPVLNCCRWSGRVLHHSLGHKTAALLQLGGINTDLSATRAGKASETHMSTLKMNWENPCCTHSDLKQSKAGFIKLPSWGPIAIPCEIAAQAAMRIHHQRLLTQQNHSVLIMKQTALWSWQRHGIKGCLNVTIQPCTNPVACCWWCFVGIAIVANPRNLATAACKLPPSEGVSAQFYGSPSQQDTIYKQTN